MAASSLFASALGEAISKWMDKEGETAEKLPALRQSALDLALNRAKAPGELQAQQLGLEKTRGDIDRAVSAERRTEELHKPGLRSAEAGATKAEQDVRRNPTVEHAGIKYEQLPDGSFRPISQMGRDPASRLVEANLNEKLTGLTQDMKFRQEVAKLSQGQDMTNPDVAFKIGIRAAYASGKFAEATEMMKLYQTLQHYKALEAGANATNKYREDLLAERRLARKALEEHRNRMAAAKEKPPLKPTDYARIMQKAQSQAYREENKMIGDPLTPQERERIEKRTNELYNKAVTASSEEKTVDPVEEALRNLAESLSDDTETATDTEE